MTEQEYLLIPKLIAEGEKGDLEAFKAAFCFMKELEVEGAMMVAGRRANDPLTTIHDPVNFQKAHSYSSDLRTHVARAAETDDSGQMYALYKDILLFDAPYDFDCFCRYIEFDRQPDKRFYLPRRKQLLPLARALQRLEERKIRLLCISMPPGVGKTTLAEFFLTWTGGKHPELPNIAGSHSNAFLR